MEGNLRFNIDWASLMVGRKFTVFALLYFVFEGNFQVQAPGGRLEFGGLIFGILRYRTCSLCLRVALPRRRRSFCCRRLLHTKISQPVYQKCGPSPHSLHISHETA